jgi:hypothetical protein
MSVPARIHLTYMSLVESVESYIHSLSNLFFKTRQSTLNIIWGDNKAVLPALNCHTGRIV